MSRATAALSAEPIDLRITFMSNLPLFRDPWAKREAWRKHPVFSSRTMFRSMFPGFGIAAVAFTAYVIAENIYGSVSKREEEH